MDIYTVRDGIETQHFLGAVTVFLLPGSKPLFLADEFGIFDVRLAFEFIQYFKNILLFYIVLEENAELHFLPYDPFGRSCVQQEKPKDPAEIQHDTDAEKSRQIGDSTPYFFTDAYFFSHFGR
jgi:hypothetical protein